MWDLTEAKIYYIKFELDPPANHSSGCKWFHFPFNKNGANSSANNCTNICNAIKKCLFPTYIFPKYFAKICIAKKSVNLCAIISTKFWVKTISANFFANMCAIFWGKTICADINSSGLQSYPSPPEWTEWSPWSSCSCKGKRSRERNCTLGGVASSPGVDHLVNFLSFFSSEVSVLPAATCPGEREEMELCGEESYLGKLSWSCDKFGILNAPLNGHKILIGKGKTKEW